LTGKTDEIIIISVFGALTLYFIAMISHIALRIKTPGLIRPYKTPLYPLMPITAAALTLIALVATAWSNPKLFLIYIGILGALVSWNYLWATPKSLHELDGKIHGPELTGG
jgi:ethanolamine permease